MSKWSISQIMNYEFEEALKKDPKKRKEVIDNLIERAADKSAPVGVITSTLNRLWGKEDELGKQTYNADEMLKAMEEAKEAQIAFMDTIG